MPIDPAAQGECGVLHYERFASDDGRMIHIYERYAIPALNCARC